MLFRRLFVAFAFVVALSSLSRAAQADGPASYESFIAGATAEHGLFTVWHKGGKVYIELAPDQVGVDFVQTIVPSSGTGGPGIVWGNTDSLAAELVRFERAGNDVAILWPQPYFIAPNVPAAKRAIDRSFANSVVALAPLAAIDEKSGKLVFDASSFLDDQMNLRALLKSALKTPDAQPYALDRDRTYFGKVKAFPNNVVIEALQDWSSEEQRFGDAVPDPRHVQIHVTYNIAQPPANDGFTSRYSDDRIGIYDDVYLTFDRDAVLSRKLRFAIRWNLQPSDPSKPLSPAKHPMVFTMSDTIPPADRPAIKAAVLKWNQAFEKIGISDALQVVDQPNDPNFDPDDIRYNMLRWVTEYEPSFGADSQTLFDPRTGEEFRTGVLISADVPRFTRAEWTNVVDPVRFGRSTDPMPQQFLDDAWRSTILHETGHNLGMQHNFIGSRAYTAKELQDPAFTAKNGIASTVMEYAPINLWPRGTGQGSYFQTDLGPYDYHVIRWTYGMVPGATTPEAEEPALKAIAAGWSDPKYRYASDEDVSWENGHATDPRVEQGILTNDPLGWCDVQFKMDHALMGDAGKYFPRRGEAYEAEKDAFALAFAHYAVCARLPAHYIGGQYLSRAHRGDPGAQPPIVPVPRSVQRRAFASLDYNVFSAAAWRLPPTLLQQLGASEWAGYGYGDVAANYGQLPHWAYDPTERHDIAYGERVATVQNEALREIFLPIVLSRIADGQGESTGDTMTLGDLFTWTERSIFREIGSGTRTIDPLRRVLQANFTGTLANLYIHPQAGAPSDARALAREELVSLEARCVKATRSQGLDRTTRAHLDLLRGLAHDALAAGRPA